MIDACEAMDFISEYAVDLDVSLFISDNNLTDLVKPINVIVCKTLCRNSWVHDLLDQRGDRMFINTLEDYMGELNIMEKPLGVHSVEILSCDSVVVSAVCRV